MIVLALQNIYKEYNGEKLFSPVSFEIKKGEHIALIGNNGKGKTTIIKMIVGEIEPDGGQIVVSKDVSIGYLSQGVISSKDNSLYEEALTAFEKLIKTEEELKKLADKLSVKQDEQSSLAYARLEEDFAKKGGYDYRYQTEMILLKFGFKKEDFSRKISTFSGGERMKAAFAKLLLIKPDLLLLDEPTNHLDVETIEWLESYLKSYSGALLFVSHDRYFIDALSDKIFELDQGQFNIYVGDYSSYSKQKQERYLTQLEAYKRQQKEIKKLQWFIEFYMPKPRFASRAHDREKKLARIEKNKIDKPTQTKNNIHINLNGKIRKGKEVLKIDDLSIGYSSSLITGINADIYGKDRIAVMGSNGSGKTTFVKTLLGQIPKLSGDIDFLIERNIGYLSQDSIQLNLDETIFDYLHSLFPDYSDQKIYDHLARYGFSYEDDKKNIQNLSGGEKMRLIIAEMTLHDYDFLILDEPTNHLDMMTKQELLDALNDYQGTLLVVSHDRYFLDALCDKVLYFFNKKAYFYQGNYTSFKQEVLDSLEAETELEKKNSPKEKKEKVIYNTHQKKVYPKLSKQKIEEKLAKLESELSQIEQDLQKEEVYSSYQKMEDLTLRQKQIETEYESLMEMLEIYEN